MTDAVAAGPFGEWLAQARAALHGDAGMQVPCGECTGCCTSAYSVQLRPQDLRAKAKIPVAFLTRASGFPAGHLTMPSLPDGLCPMLKAGKCSIYHDRPQTCLDYDCRIFAAAGLEAGAGKITINERVRAWTFSYPTEADRMAHDAVRSTAAFIREKRSSFRVPVPNGPSGIAVLAVKAYPVFLDPEIGTRQDLQIAEAIAGAGRAFDEGLDIAPGAATPPRSS